MKYVVSTLMLIALCVVNVSSGSIGVSRDNLDRYSLLKMVEKCELVVTGRVQSMVFVHRTNVTPAGGGIPTTDVTIAVDDVIRGTPNAGEDLVTFMIEGGKGVNPETGEVQHLRVTHQGNFKVGEDVLLFLGKAEGDAYHANFAHDGLHLYFGDYGKSPIKDDMVGLVYEGAGQRLKLTKVPVDLAVTLGQAAVLDKDRAVLVENVIKALVLADTGDTVSITPAMSVVLTQNAQRIIDDDSEPQTD